jgi:hypothetical protein
MKEFDVSFEIVSKSIGLSKLSSLIGLNCSPDSHDMGEPKGKRKWEKTYWKLFSNEPKSATIEDHLDNIFFQMSKSSILIPENRIQLLPGDCSFYISIGIFFNEESENNLVEIVHQMLEKISFYKLDLEICLYPSNMD